MKQEHKKYHIVYKTVNRLNGKEYIGVHSADTLDDRYLGTGSTMREAVRKHGKESFDRTNLYVFQTRDEALAKEREIVDEKYVLNQRTYNAALGGGGRYDYARGEDSPLFGRKLSPEHSKNISRSQLGVPCPNRSQSGKKNPMYGIRGADHPRARAVEVRGLRYACGVDAAKANNIARSTLVGWIKEGTNGAKYL